MDKKLFSVEMLNGSVEDNDLVLKLSVNCKLPSDCRLNNQPGLGNAISKFC